MEPGSYISKATGHLPIGERNRAADSVILGEGRRSLASVAMINAMAHISGHRALP